MFQNLFFNKVAGLMPATLLKKGLWYRSFSAKVANFLRTSFLIEHVCWLLLPKASPINWINNLVGIFLYKPKVWSLYNQFVSRQHLVLWSIWDQGCPSSDWSKPDFLLTHVSNVVDSPRNCLQEKRGENWWSQIN